MQIRHILAGLCCLAALSQPAFAKVLEVGEGKAYSKLAEAAGAAQPGDTIHISDGEYFDCGVFRRDNLIIEGSSEAGTVLTDKACEGKALLVLGGSGITVRNLTLTRAPIVAHVDHIVASAWHPLKVTTRGPTRMHGSCRVPPPRNHRSRIGRHGPPVPLCNRCCKFRLCAARAGAAGTACIHGRRASGTFVHRRALARELRQALDRIRKIGP